MTHALIVVDVQNDFCPGGSLAVPDGDAVVAHINELVPRFPVVVFTQDWHPPGHVSFSDHPEFTNGSWPAHCVAGTEGAALHPGLRVPRGALRVRKGTQPDREALSAFQGTDLDALLEEAGVRAVTVVGLATDHCVRATALDAGRAGLDVTVDLRGCRGVDVPRGSVASAIREMEAAGIRIVGTG